MDISNYIVSNDPQKLIVKHPVTGEKTDIILDVLSLDDQGYKAKLIKISREKLEASHDASAEDIAKMALEKRAELLASLIKGWKGMSKNGKDHKFSEKNAIKVLSECPWLADQVESFASERANFFHNAKTS